MDLERELAMRALGAHPLAAAGVLERLPAEEVARFLEDAGPEQAARVLGAMHPPAAAAAMGVLEAPVAAGIVERVPLDLASPCVRRLDDEHREALLAALPRRRARSLRALQRFAPNTAGALMDPDVLALPADLSVAEATVRVREAAHHARYNLYIIGRDQRLVGVLNLRELFLAAPEAPLSSIALTNPYRIAAGADPHAIVAHPGWREAHALPVVDEQGVYLGAIRYRTLRRLEDALRGSRFEAGATARALGELIRTGATSVLEAVVSPAPRRASTVESE